MKANLSNSLKKLSFFLLFSSFFSSTFAQYIPREGDYRSKNSGSWSGCAVGEVRLSGSGIDSVSMFYEGYYPEALPTTSFRGGSGATATVIRSGTGIIQTRVTDAGSGYSLHPYILFSSPSTAAQRSINWEVYVNNAWIQATTPPTLDNHVTIRSGHTVYLCNGISANARSLTIEKDAVLAAPNTPLEFVQTLNVNGNVHVEGTFGVANVYNADKVAPGSGIRLLQHARDTSIFSGGGKFRIASIEPSQHNDKPQVFIIDTDMELRRNSSGTCALSLLNGDQYKNNKTLIIRRNRTVKIPAGGFHQAQNATTPPTDTIGSQYYHIEYGATLDLSGAGQFNLISSDNWFNRQQELIMNVYGNLKLGSVVRLVRLQTTQKLDVNIRGVIDASANTLNTAAGQSTNAGVYPKGTIYSWFTMLPPSTFMRRLNGSTATPFWIGTSNVDYTPFSVNNAGTGVANVTIAEGCSPYSLQTNFMKAIGKTWRIGPAQGSNLSEKGDFTFSYNDGHAHFGCEPAQAMQMAYFDHQSFVWRAAPQLATPVAGTATQFDVTFTNVPFARYSSIVIGNSGILATNQGLMMPNTQSTSTTRFYPSVTRNNLTVEIGKGQTADVTITNLAGQTVFSQMHMSGTNSVDVAQLPASVYVIAFRQNGQSTIGKFVKQ